jgi:hypothetical protein
VRRDADDRAEQAVRGRVFGMLRTAMQAAYPLGGALAPPLAARGGVSLGFLVALLVIAVPGLVGLGVLGEARAQPSRASSRA